MNIIVWFSTCGMVGLVFPLIGVKFQLSSNNPTLCLTVFDNEVASLIFNSIHTAYAVLPGMVIAWCYIKIYLAIREYNATVAQAIRPVPPHHAVTPSTQQANSNNTTTQSLRTRDHEIMPSVKQHIFKNGSAVAHASSLRSDTSQHGSSSSSQGQDLKHTFEERKLLKMLAVVMAGFFICWLPGFVFGILQMAKPVGNDTLQYLNLFYYFPAYTSSVINPVIYATMSQKFRVEFCKIICRE